MSIKKFLQSAKCLATYVTVNLYGPGPQEIGPVGKTDREADFGAVQLQRVP